MDENTILQTGRKLGITDAKTLSKAHELHRIFNLKNRTPINDAAKVVLSLDCASNSLGTDFDHDVALKLSGLLRKDYTQKLQLFRTLVNLKNQLQVITLCIQLELPNNVKQAATNLLTEYKKQLREQGDIAMAQNVAMAVFLAAKRYKLKSSNIKTHLCKESGLTSAQWTKLEKEWVKWIEEKQPFAENGKVLQQSSMVLGDNASTDEQQTKTRKPRNATAEIPYEVWKEDILEKAYALIRGEPID